MLTTQAANNISVTTSANETSRNRYQLKQGDTLWNIARSRYGNRHYSTIIITHNNISRPESLSIGTSINTPDIDILLQQEGVYAILQYEMPLILQAYLLFTENEATLIESRLNNRKQRIVSIPEKARYDLSMASEIILQAKNILTRNSISDSNFKNRIAAQLQPLSIALRELSAGSNDGYGYDTDMIHQRIVRIIDYAIHWSRQNADHKPQT